MTIFYYNKLPLTVYVHKNNKRRQTWMIKQHVAMVLLAMFVAANATCLPSVIVEKVAGVGGSYPLSAVGVEALQCHCVGRWQAAKHGRLRQKDCLRRGCITLPPKVGWRYRWADCVATVVAPTSCNISRDSCIQCTQSTTIKTAAFNALSQQQLR